MSAHQNVTPLFSPANASRPGGARLGAYAMAPLWAAGLRLPSMPKGLRPSVPKAVLLALAARADWNTGRCHPGLACLALDTGLHERTVRQGIAFLVEKGLVSRTPRGCRGTEYAVLMPVADAPNVEPGPTLDPPNVEPGPGFEVRNVEPTPVFVPPDPPNVGPGPTKLEERKKEKSRSLRSLSRSLAARSDDDFAAFYAAYPRKKQPDEALKAWRQAIRKGATPAQLMEALARHRFRDDPLYDPYPASWLRKGSWKDEPDAAAPPRPAAGLHPRRETPSEERRRKLGITSMFDRGAPATLDGEASHARTIQH